jgi:hypothetical protein
MPVGPLDARRTRLYRRHEEEDEKTDHTYIVHSYFADRAR